jgi:hypothetical protein
MSYIQHFLHSYNVENKKPSVPDWRKISIPHSFLLKKICQFLLFAVRGVEMFCFDTWSMKLLDGVKTFDSCDQIPVCRLISIDQSWCPQLGDQTLKRVFFTLSDWLPWEVLSTNEDAHSPSTCTTADKDLRANRWWWTFIIVYDCL